MLNYDVSPFREPSTEDISLVFYNRVPKCGSSTLEHILYYVSNVNNFRYSECGDYRHWRLNNNDYIAFIRSLTVLSRPFVIDRHLFYVKCTDIKNDVASTERERKLKEPIYINMVRDPVEQAISNYYYDRLDGMSRKNFSEKEKKKTIEECLAGASSGQDLASCGLNMNLYAQWFCGHSDDCLYNITYAVETAIYNIDSAYTFIGITEHFELSLKAFEKLLPRYFNGSVAKYQTRIRKKVTSNKVEPSPYIKGLLKQYLHPSYIVYNHIKKKFDATIAKLGIPVDV
ncbi:unnamed protein product [Owenia fusiformis]|uniref:Uncharacterized protein n=1 Tax=Owenia fusiformis TaxID=6347 RepID=A0A8J1U6K9_OWEFU|nr:unnamed protein product [Owenia fusiformis]